MILGISISHRDSLQCERLLNWLFYLDSKNRYSLKRVGCVLCVSPMAHDQPRYQIIRDVADKIFGKVTEHVPENLREVGWPGSPNQMFAALLRFVNGEDDVLFIEPDVAPITIDWYQSLEEEWETVAKPGGYTFMGALVGYDQSGKPHMTGNGIYGRDWVTLAPLLGQATTEAWDTFAAGQVMPRAHFTRLIQHRFNNPGIPDDLSILKKETVLFHQNKDGRLINLLNRNRWGGELNNGEDPVTIFEPMTKYYHAFNCNRRIKGPGNVQFQFETYGQSEGVWVGVLAIEDEQTQAALDSMASNPKTGVTSISESEYSGYIKKKLTHSSHVKLPPQVPPRPAHLLAKDAAVAGSKSSESPSAKPGSPAILKPVQLPQRVDEVIKIGKVSPSPTAEFEPPRKNKRKL